MFDTRTDNRDPWEIAKEHFACDCSARRLSAKRDSLGRTHFVMQCSVCGSAEPVKKTELTQREMDAAPDFDAGLADRWNWQRQSYARELHNARREASHAEFHAEHEAFLRSETWKDMRRRVFDRCGGICEGCRMRRAVQVHHRNYTYKFGREMLFDLVAVCRECHEAIHDPANLRNPPTA